MESAIIMLDENTDQATRQMLQKVIEKKRKYERLKNKHIFSIWTSMIMAVLLFGYVYYYIVVPYSSSFFTMFSMFVDRFSHFVFLSASIGMYGYMLMIKKKMDKAEKEYHGLRCEIIDKSKDLWKKEQEWKNRHKVFEMMKSNYDINLYHESK
jgi:hypothetical protein